jgi:hypothetical protein
LRAKEKMERGTTMAHQRGGEEDEEEEEEECGRS